MRKSDWVMMVLLVGVIIVGGLGLIKSVKQSERNTTLYIQDMTQVPCDDIVGKPNAYTGKRDLVCEIGMQQEDDNLIILKENK